MSHIEQLVAQQADPPRAAGTHLCPSCGKPWYSAAVADDCCGDWLGYD